MNKQAELFCQVNCTLGEGPVWDHVNHRLYWVDIVEKKIHSCEASADAILGKPIELHQMVGAFSFRSQGGMIAAIEDGFVGIDSSTHQVTPLAEVEQDMPTHRFNDGKCDPAGRFWAGSMAKNGSGKSGSLYSIDKNHHVVRHLDQLGISNGLCWNSKADTLYFIDSALSSVQAFDYDLVTGTITNPRTVITIDSSEGLPDGMTIDQEGMLWIAHWGGWQVSRWNPQTGKKVGVVSVPAENVTSCVFGGHKMNQLYITTASIGIDSNHLAKQPHAGSVFVVELDVAGSVLHTFAG
jgi:sugar lactone lactonase YvrE